MSLVEFHYVHLKRIEAMCFWLFMIISGDNIFLLWAKKVNYFPSSMHAM